MLDRIVELLSQRLGEIDAVTQGNEFRQDVRLDPCAPRTVTVKLH